MRRSFLLMCLVIVPGIQSLAQVIHVPCDQPSIQAGIDAAAPGDTVLVAEGTYYENINYKGKALTLASLFLLDSDTAHISRTIIDGSRATDLIRASVVTLCSGEDSTSVLCGFTITGGTGTYLTDAHTDADILKWRYMCGGGILMHHSGGKVINNIIEYNPLQADTIRGSLGGGIMANVSHRRTAVIRSNIIRNNSIRKHQGWGAGVCLFGGRILVEHNAIVDNSIEVQVLAEGAGIFFENDFTEEGIGRVAIRNNIIAGNRALSKADQALGGGIGLCYGEEDKVLEVSHNIIFKNFTDGIGGGLYSFSSRGLVAGNLIFDNVAEMYGGAIAGEQEQMLVMEYNHIWSGNVWLVSSQGLCKLSVSRTDLAGMIPFLTQRDPLFTDRFSLDPSTGRLFIGEKDGMLSFRPYSVPLQSFAPPMVVIDFRLNGSSSSAHHDFQLDLPYEENFLKFKFSALELAGADVYRYGPRGYEFRYFMEGLDKDTSITGMDLTAQYQNLKPGRYRFMVIRTEGEDKLNPVNMSLRLRIHPPWYRSGLALGSYALFLVILIAGISQYRTARLRKEKLVLESEVDRRTAELKQMNVKLLETERQKTRFFTDIAHEIRTPLSLISGPIDQLIVQDYRDPKILRWLHLIRRNSQRLIRLVNQLLDISKLDAGHMKLVLEESDVTDHIRLLASEYISRANSKGIHYIIDIPEEKLLTFYDREKLEKVTTNLLSNAFKFTPTGGTVSCRLKIFKGRSGNMEPQIRLIVADTGTGIPASMQIRIFERFYRGEDDSSSYTEGSGIGLSLTRELVQVMHGEIAVKSKVGKGTVFLVTFPAGCAHLNQDEFVLKEPGIQTLTGETESDGMLPDGHIQEQHPVSVLVVEDNEDLKAFLLENLAAEFKVYGAQDGDRGLDTALSELPDLIITDVMMPGGLDGMELCSRVKNDERTSHIPVILLTAKSTSRDRITGLEKGADDYIVKPFSMDELLVRIRNLLRQRESLRKKYSSMIGVDWEQVSITNLDEKFLKNILGIISENLSDFNFNVGTLQEKMFMSREHIFRKLKALTGTSPSSLIRTMRLKAAASLLERGEKSITRIAMQVGFSNPSYFSQCFKAYFDRSPSEYMLMKRAGYTP